MLFRSIFALIAVTCLFAFSACFADAESTTAAPTITPDTKPKIVDCPALIINASNNDWTLMFISNTPVTLIDPPAGCTNISCTISAHSNLHFNYRIDTEHLPTEDGNIPSISIQDSSGARRVFNYGPYAREYCPIYISHNGATGPVALNETSKGSIVIEGDNW